MNLSKLPLAELRDKVLAKFNSWLDDEALPEEVESLLRGLQNGTLKRIADMSQTQLLIEADGYDWPCEACDDGLLVCDTCLDCGDRHCGHCEPCETEEK